MAVIVAVGARLVPTCATLYALLREAHTKSRQSTHRPPVNSRQSEGEPVERTEFTDLPPEIIELVLRHANVADVLAVARVSKRLHGLVHHANSSSSLWRALLRRDFAADGSTIVRSRQRQFDSGSPYMAAYKNRFLIRLYHDRLQQTGGRAWRGPLRRHSTVDSLLVDECANSVYIVVQLFALLVRCLVVGCVWPVHWLLCRRLLSPHNDGTLTTTTSVRQVVGDLLHQTDTEWDQMSVWDNLAGACAAQFAAGNGSSTLQWTMVCLQTVVAVCLAVCDCCAWLFCTWQQAIVAAEWRSSAALPPDQRLLFLLMDIGRKCVVLPVLLSHQLVMLTLPSLLWLSKADSTKAAIMGLDVCLVQFVWLCTAGVAYHERMTQFFVDKAPDSDVNGPQLMYKSSTAIGSLLNSLFWLPVYAAVSIWFLIVRVVARSPHV